MEKTGILPLAWSAARIENSSEVKPVFRITSGLHGFV